MLRRPSFPLSLRLYLRLNPAGHVSAGLFQALDPVPLTSVRVPLLIPHDSSQPGSSRLLFSFKTVSATLLLLLFRIHLESSSDLQKNLTGILISGAWVWGYVTR